MSKFDKIPKELPLSMDPEILVDSSSKPLTRKQEAIIENYENIGYIQAMKGW